LIWEIASRHILIVGDARGTEQDTQDQTRTLGDLLYANTKALVTENDWVGLVDSMAAGDQVALHALYERAHRLVFTLIMRIVNNRETAEELTLDVFHDVWRGAAAYDPANGSVLGWIMNQARSRAIDRLRFDNRKKRVNAYPSTPVITTAATNPEEACRFEEEKRLLGNALEILTPEERKAIETAFFSELTYEETAVKLNQPLGTVKTRIRSGLGKLRETLAALLKVS
jgi:RNA polymerase sigma-70 factor (ECF subfamily)